MNEKVWVPCQPPEKSPHCASLLGVFSTQEKEVVQGGLYRKVDVHVQESPYFSLLVLVRFKLN